MSSKLDEFIIKIILFLLKLIHKNDQNELAESLAQFVKFCMVGVTNTILSYGINVLVLKSLQPYEFSWDYIAGNVIAFVISVAWSFYWNNKYVFVAGEGQRRNSLLALLKTYISYGFTGIILTNVLSYIWIIILDISKYITPLINLVISIPLNFIINKFWAFKTD